MAEEWGRFLVDRVRGSPFGDSGHGFRECDVKAYLCPSHGDIEQSCGISDFLRSLLVKERIDTVGCLEDDNVIKLEAFCLVDCRDEHHPATYSPAIQIIKLYQKKSLYHKSRF